MAAGGFDIAKAGWLYRQSSVLHRWKKNWFVLDRQGDLRYFENPDHPRAEERIVVRAAVVAIKAGYECGKADVPEGSAATAACFLELVMRDKESMLLCAESPDEMKAWQIALEEARTLTPDYRPGVTSTTIITPPGYVYGSPYGGYGYPGQVLSPPPTQVIRTPDGTTTTIVNAPPYQQVVYVDDGPFRYRPYSYGAVYPVPFFFW
ncbi:unnamed protein product [Candidula unifasciata]|uniref:PH domain-containing protein n=1 Tax=Candidula unifasciata TaxID=100452 RepID=A0A8S3ZNE0_9EUPU|nr:unnamed protein product [Candidula unifasciata]